MKTHCPKCTKETFENGQCSNCGYDDLQIGPPPALTTTTPAAAEARVTPTAPPKPAAPPVTRAVASAPDAPAPQSVPPRPPAPRPVPPPPPSAPPVSPFERVASPATSPPDPLPAKPQTSTAEALNENENKWEKWEEQLVRAYEEGFRIITLIGFSGAGKTFFANRLRRELRLAPQWAVSPGEADVIRRSAAEIEWTEITRHDRRPRRYLLADVDGEAYRASVQQLVGKQQTDPKMRRFLLLTAVASAYVLMIPARAALDTKDLERQTEKLVDRFDIIVGVILALRKRLAEKSGNVRAAVLEPITEEHCRLALRDELTCSQPVHVLFAQADTYDDIAVQERDPYIYAMRNGNTLYRTVNKHFPTHRFDFVTAFDGHQENYASLVDYGLPAYGTTAAFDWIDAMCSDRVLATRMTAAAKITRSIIDGGFRKTMARMTGR
jgi:hypothetical protein